MTPLLLLTVAAALGGLAPSRLARARWVYRAPRLGALAWPATVYTVLGCLLLAGLTAALHWDPTHDLLCASWRVCLDSLRGAHGPAGQAAAVAGLALVVGVLARVGFAAARLWRSTVRQRSHHAALLALVGQATTPDGAATVVPHSRPAAYLVPGRRARVVVTAGALALLSRDELAAVLAHERAHASGHHHRLLDAVRLLHQAFPLAVFRQAHRQVARLVELRADDIAAGTHSRLALARALVVMAAPAEPAGVLRIDGGDTAERVRRLLDPPPPLPRLAAAAVAVGLGALGLLPVVIVVLGRLVSIA